MTIFPHFQGNTVALSEKKVMNRLKIFRACCAPLEKFN